MDKNVEMLKFILNNIDKSAKRLNEVNESIEAYRIQIEAAGKSSSLGQVLTKELSMLKGERNSLTYRIGELKNSAEKIKSIVGDNINLESNTDNESENLDHDDNDATESQEVKEQQGDEQLSSEEIQDTMTLTSEEELKAENSEPIENLEYEYLDEDLTNYSTSNETKQQNNTEYTSNDTQQEDFVLMDSYRVSYLAVYRGTQFLDAIEINYEEEILEKADTLYQKYGKDIGIMASMDGYKNGQLVSKDIGFVGLDELYGNHEESNKMENETKIEDISDDTQQEDSKTFDNYKVSYLAASRGAKVLDTIEINDEKEIQEKADILYQKYGEDINIEAGIDGYKNGQLVSKDISFVSLDAINKTLDLGNINKNDETENLVEDSIIEDDYITEENTITEDDSDKSKEREIKIEYNTKSGYEMHFNEMKDGKAIPQKASWKLSRKLLNDTKERERIIKKYGIDKNSKFYKKMDVNLIPWLDGLDQLYGTHYVSDYKNNGLKNIKLKYNVSEIFSCKDLSFKERFTQYRTAVNQKKLANAIIEYPKSTKFFKVAVPTAVVAVVLGVTSIVTSTISKKSSSNDSIGKRIERDFALENTDNSSFMDSILEKADEILNEATVDKEHQGLAIHDAIPLFSKDDNGSITTAYQLSKTVNGKEEKILASNFKDCDKFRISAIDVYQDGKIIETVKNSNITTVDIYDKYGKNIDLLLSFDAYKEGQKEPTYKYIGSITYNAFKGKQMVAVNDEPIKSDSIDDTFAKSESENKQDNATYTEVFDFGLDNKIDLVFKDGSGNPTVKQILTDDAWGNGKQVLASKLECDYFKVSRIAAYSGSTVLDTITINEGDSVNLELNRLFQEYGADINISCNFNGYNNGETDSVYADVGWLDMNQIVNITDEQKQSIAKTGSNASAKQNIKVKK